MSKDQIGDMTPKFYGGRTKTDIEKSLEAEIQQLKAGLARAHNCIEVLYQEQTAHTPMYSHSQEAIDKAKFILSDPLGVQAYEEVQQLTADNQELKDVLDGKDAEIESLKIYIEKRNTEIAGEVFNLQSQKGALIKECETLKTALDFAKGAIMDAVSLEDGLDGSTGEAVMRIITEAQEKGTFDKELADTFTTLERRFYDESEKLAQEKEALEKRVKELEVLLEIKASPFKDGCMCAECMPAREAISALKDRIRELEKAVDYYERDGAMIKAMPLETVNKIKALESKLEKAMKVVEAANKYAEHWRLPAMSAYSIFLNELEPALLVFKQE